jgi:hypothetical protein
MDRKYDVWIHRDAKIDRLPILLGDFFGRNPADCGQSHFDEFEYYINVFYMKIRVSRKKHFDAESGQYSSEYPVRICVEPMFGEEDYIRLQNLLSVIIAGEAAGELECRVLVFDDHDVLIRSFGPDPASNG